MAKHEIWELQELQALPLDLKIKKSQLRIREWVNEFGVEGVYVSFSGGKDSTVLLHLVRSLYPDVKAMFVDTGLEYPEIREFVKTFDNVDWVRPKKNFKQVIQEYGYPFISKEISDAVNMAKRGYKSGIDKLNGVDKDGNFSNFRNGYQKWKFLIDAPFDVADDCCHINKKKPAKDYEHETGKHPFIGTMTVESAMRKSAWLKVGCNAFESQRPISTPMAFWTEQDVLRYIQKFNLPLASVYGDLVDDFVNLKTTGCQRTGCMFCGYGCHLKNDQRFINMKETHPAQYNYIMKPVEEGGLGYKSIIDWLNEHGNLHIKY